MNFREILGFSVVLAVAVVACNQVSADKMPEVKCLGQPVDLKHFFSGFMECAKEVMSADDIAKFNDANTSAEEKKALGKKAHANMCVSVCQWKKHGHLLTDDSKLNEAQLSETVKVFPEAAREDFKTALKKCFDDNSSTFSTDDNCKGYKGFADCLHKAYKDVCKEDMPCEQ